MFPFHAFLFFPVLSLVVLALSLALPKRAKEAEVDTSPDKVEAVASRAWVPDCTVPWAPGCEPERTAVGAAAEG